MTTTHETSMVVHAHACVIEGITYRFGVRWAAAEELAEPAFARVLLHVHVTVGDRPFAKLSIMAPLAQPAQIPRLLTDALRECLNARRSRA